MKINIFPSNDIKLEKSYHTLLSSLQMDKVEIFPGSLKDPWKHFLAKFSIYHYNNVLKVQIFEYLGSVTV